MAKIKDEQSIGQKKRSKKDGKPTRSRKKAGWLTFLEEVNVEMRKVTWPSRKEIFGSTTALIIATLMISAFLGTVDMVLAKGVQPALAGNADVWSYVTLLIFTSILVWVYKSN
ncbi:preprotein translocase subunit SecE [bacterium]|nr:preprotein translocase subunit SecE [bacterium]